jgi:hypothetical protein
MLGGRTSEETAVRCVLTADYALAGGRARTRARPSPATRSPRSDHQQRVPVLQRIPGSRAVLDPPSPTTRDDMRRHDTTRTGPAATSSRARDPRTAGSSGPPRRRSDALRLRFRMGLQRVRAMSRFKGWVHKSLSVAAALMARMLRTYPTTAHRFSMRAKRTPTRMAFSPRKRSEESSAAAESCRTKLTMNTPTLAQRLSVILVIVLVIVSSLVLTSCGGGSENAQKSGTEQLTWGASRWGQAFWR